MPAGRTVWYDTKIRTITVTPWRDGHINRAVPVLVSNSYTIEVADHNNRDSYSAT